METKESQLEDYQVNLLARFKALFNELKTQQTRKDVEDFFDVFIEVSYENWPDKEIDEIDNIMVSLPNEIIASAAEYLRVGTGSSVDWEFILFFG